MAKSASGKYQGSLSLEWFNKQKAVLLLGEEDPRKEGDIPAPRINWINREDALFYEIDEKEGKGLSPYWVDRNDIRVKEARPLLFKNAYIAEPKDKPGSLLGIGEVEYTVRESSEDDPAIKNWLIKGDNLLALNALKRHFDKLPEQERVKCIFIDPPYNTGSAFEQYDDSLERSEWLTLMRDRLVLLRALLKLSGSIWISIDDRESHYLKVLCDEVFGASNFVANVVWQKMYTVKNSARFFSDMHDHILVYARNIDDLELNLLPRSSELDDTYTNPDNDPEGPWTTNAIQARNFYSLGTYEISSPSGKKFLPPAGTYWRVSKENFDRLNSEGRIWWGKDGNSIPRIKRYLSEAKGGVIPATIWFHADVGQNAEAKIEARSHAPDDESVFSTPKPEKLLKRVIELASNPGEIILDAFGGSGTTFASAGKMGRHWVGVELGKHAESHIIPRLKDVISGLDRGGISEAVNWTGGGSFKYYHLGPSIINVDKVTGKGEFNWKLGREFLQESLLQSYDFVPDVAIEFGQDFAGDRPAIGRLETAKGVVFGVAWLVAHDEPVVSIDAKTVQALYITLKEHGPKSIHIFTNKGWDIKQDAMPPDMEIIKVPHAIFAELER